jgi:hypothetical protein
MPLCKFYLQILPEVRFCGFLIYIYLRPLIKKNMSKVFDEMKPPTPHTARLYGWLGHRSGC